MAVLERRVGALPPLHSPFDRELLARVGPWEVRRHARDDGRFAYLATRSMLHVQLWHPDHRVSVLTPSRLTGGRFEIASSTRRAWVADWDAVVAQLPDHQLPRRSDLAALSLWLVVRHETSDIKERRCRGEEPRAIAVARPASHSPIAHTSKDTP
jgi:hypothetical protein